MFLVIQIATGIIVAALILRALPQIIGAAFVAARIVGIIVCILIGVICWIIGDKRGEAYNGYLVFLGYVFLFLAYMQFKLAANGPAKQNSPIPSKLNASDQSRLAPTTRQSGPTASTSHVPSKGAGAAFEGLFDEKMRDWLECAQTGDVIAQNEVGLSFAFGLRGAPKDGVKAAHWFRLAANNKSEDSQTKK